METYYRNQAQSPYYRGQIRQRGSGIGALVAGLGRVALPIFRNVILPMAKNVGKELIKQGVPELMDVIGNQKTPKDALRSTVSKTFSGQLGRGRSRRRRKRGVKRTTSTTKARRKVTNRKARSVSTRAKPSRKRKSSQSKASKGKRSRLSFFSKVQNAY